MQKNRSLKHLLLFHELFFVLLVILAVAAGSYGIQQWHTASVESVRINQIAQEIQQTRGDLYRQMKELFDAQFLADVEAQTEYDSYSVRIEDRFRRLELLSGGSDERAAISGMRLAYGQFLSETRPLLTVTAAVDSNALRKTFNTDLELKIFRHYEMVTDTAEKLFARKQQDIHQRLRQANRMAMILLGIPVALAVILLLFSRTFLQHAIARPLASVLRAAQEISAGKLRQKVPETGAAELVKLAGAINQMADDLSASQEALMRSEKQAAQGALVPVLAHNIRNPLASIRAIAQVSDDPALDSDTREAFKGIIETVDRLERWTGSLLTYLHPLRPQPTVTTLVTIVSGALAPLKPKLEERGIKVIIEGCDAINVEVDVSLMEQAFYNLILNAIEASAPGTTIEISGRHEDTLVTLQISDNGTGMPFQPEFKTLTPGPSTKQFGTGLGIPFAFKVCETLGGDISFSDRNAGGTIVRLSWHNRLP